MGSGLSGKRAAILGAGKMGGILLKALLDKKLLAPKATSATVQHQDRAIALSKQLGIAVGTDNLAAVRGADIVLICVKPQVVGDVINRFAPIFRRNSSSSQSLPRSPPVKSRRRSEAGCRWCALCPTLLALADRA
jgi:hypothetical protein